MSKLSATLKSLIGAAHARPGTAKAPANIKSLYSKIGQEAHKHNVGVPAWLTVATATTMTMNSPDALLQLFQAATQDPPSSSTTTTTPVQTAELMREVGLKCIGFNGVPRTINCLGAFRDGLPEDVGAGLATAPTRHIKADNAAQIVSRGRGLWNSIYRPFEDKLVDKLARSHPDLPVHILESEYGGLFSDPERRGRTADVGRVLTSLAAVACLRAQTGVGPQVISHVFGLRKAFEDGTAEKDVEGGEWLASDEGNQWVIHKVDEIVQAIGGDQGGNFANPRAKL